MEGALLLLLPISLAFALLIGAFFWWATFSGQFEDSEKAATSILNDDDTPGRAEAARPPPH